jgi:hypothetical protein
MQRLLYVFGAGIYIGHIEPAGHVGAGIWPHTGAYSIVHATALPTCTFVEACALCPEASRTVTDTVYVPAEEYECVKVEFCINDALAPIAALVGAYAFSSPHVML